MFRINADARLGSHLALLPATTADERVCAILPNLLDFAGNAYPVDSCRVILS